MITYKERIDSITIANAAVDNFQLLMALCLGYVDDKHSVSEFWNYCADRLRHEWKDITTPYKFMDPVATNYLSLGGSIESESEIENGYQIIFSGKLSEKMVGFLDRTQINRDTLDKFWEFNVIMAKKLGMRFEYRFENDKIITAVYSD